MNPNSIMSDTRKKMGISLFSMCKVLDVSPQMILNYERGDPIPVKRIRSWATDPNKPEWVREMAHRMLKSKIDELREMLKEPVGDERATENG
jgi:transcriptional regulator with XRE-family HTH domain